jgi:predicted tellurium resistance membrane protein TerC
MRLVVGQLIVLVQRYPALVDGAFIIIAWVGFKLGVEYLHDAHYISLEIPRWLSLGLIVVIFLIAFVYARMQGPVDDVDPLTESAEHMLEGETVTNSRE